MRIIPPRVIKIVAFRTCDGRSTLFIRNHSVHSFCYHIEIELDRFYHDCVLEKVEPQAGFEFALHGADVHEVPRPPHSRTERVVQLSYQGGDLTGLSYWGFRVTTKGRYFGFRMKIGDKDFYKVL